MSPGRHTSPTPTNKVLLCLVVIASCATMIVMSLLGLMTSELIQAFVNILRVVLAM